MEIDINIKVTKAKIKLIRDKKTERMFRSRVKWHEEGEKNKGHPPFTPNSVLIQLLRFLPNKPLLGGGMTLTSTDKKFKE